MEKEKLQRMRAAFRSVIDRQRENAGRIPNLSERLERLRKAREASAGNEALLAKAVSTLEENGVRVLFASDSEQALRIVKSELEGERILAKSKSNLSREIDLVAALEKEGIEVVETDIGDRIIQLSGEHPVHPTGPTAHLDRHQIVLILKEALGIDADPEPASIIKAVRDDLLQRIEKARVGLTGVNAVCAEEGALLFIHNEGNIDLVSQRNKKLIVLASPEKVYSDLEDAVNMARIETYYATGQPITSFMRMVAGPSRTADIEKELFTGVHGPSEVVVVFIDNNRSFIARDEKLKPLLHCIGCGSCLLECPVYDVKGPEFGSRGLYGGYGASKSVAIEGPSASVERGITMCLTCARCRERCPVRIDVPGTVERARSLIPRREDYFPEEYRTLIQSVRNYSNPFMQPSRLRDRWAANVQMEADYPAGRVLFFAGCSLSYIGKDNAVRAVSILRKAGLSVTYLGKDEKCCGSTVIRIGDEALFLELARSNIERFSAQEEPRIVTICPGCHSAISRYREYFPGFTTPIVHITEVILEALREGKFDPSLDEPVRITYHDPCHLGRGSSIYLEPREVLKAVKGVELVEMERSAESSYCCGSGGGVKTVHPDIALEIAKNRVEMAEDTGAESLVTCCPWCEATLREAADQKGSPIRVESILSLLDRALEST